MAQTDGRAEDDRVPVATAGDAQLPSSEARDHRWAQILIVDDEEVNVRLLLRILNEAGYENVTGTQDPAAVPELCEQLSPQLILLDLRMPGIDGFEVIRRLPTSGPAGAPIPVLVLTGDAAPAPRRKALELGARDFVTKPFDQIEVLLRVRNILDVQRLQLGLADRNALLDQEVWERTKELESAQHEVLSRLALAAEFRDDATQQHAYRIGRTSALIAAELGLPEGQQTLLAQAAPLHDIGKIGVSDSLLMKPGRLDADEFEIVKRHAAIGARLLAGSRVPVVHLAERIALTHHEHWDGNGYPDGLSGTAIPLCGRIVGVADVFDALVSARPYKEPWPVERAVAEILDHSDRQFEPRIVDAFGGLDHESLLSTVERDGLFSAALTPSTEDAAALE